jgi:hypothetical protein
VLGVVTRDREPNDGNGHADTRCGDEVSTGEPAVPSIAITGGCSNVAWMVHILATRRAASSRRAGSEGQLKRMS